MDLTLAGHAHGGLIRLPGTDGLVGPKREILPHYTAGLYDLSYGQMVVSRGLGNQFPCFRLFNRPDVPFGGAKLRDIYANAQFAFVFPVYQAGFRMKIHPARAVCW